MDDYSGAFDPDFDLTALSRRALSVLGREWLLHGHLQDRVGMPLVHEGRPREVMEEVAIVEWMGASPVYSIRSQHAFSFHDGNVPTIMKNLQLDIGAPHQFMDFRCEVFDENHGEFYLAHCGALMDVEPMGEEYVEGMCHAIEDPTFDATAGATNPRAQVRPIHRPPRVPSDLVPHCRWTVEIDPSFPPVSPHPNRALVESSLIAGISVHTPDVDPDDGGWDDYNRDFDPDFGLEDFSHRALVVALQEFAVQSHLLFRAFLLTVAQRFGEEEAARINPLVFTGLAGLTAQRLIARDEDRWRRRRRHREGVAGPSGLLSPDLRRHLGGSHRRRRACASPSSTPPCSPRPTTTTGSPSSGARVTVRSTRSSRQ